MQCDKCEGATEYNAGFIGLNYEEGPLFVLNHSDSRALEPDLFDSYETALWRSQTGRILQTILDQSGLKRESIAVTNVFKCLLPDDKEPAPSEYKNCIPMLEQQVAEIQPTKVIACGRFAYRYMFLKDLCDFQSRQGHVMEYQGIPTLIAEHPCTLWRMPKEKRQKQIEKIIKFLD